MKLEQKIVAIYTVAGLMFGVISHYLTASSLLLALVLPVVSYFITVWPFVKLLKEKDTKKNILSGFMTFFLVWITVWIFFYNLKV
jgi:Mn2+/Fe2+ NRAMP family transporter